MFLVGINWKFRSLMSLQNMHNRELSAFAACHAFLWDVLRHISLLRRLIGEKFEGWLGIMFGDSSIFRTFFREINWQVKCFRYRKGISHKVASYTHRFNYEHGMDNIAVQLFWLLSLRGHNCSIKPMPRRAWIIQSCREIDCGHCRGL